MQLPRNLWEHLKTWIGNIRNGQIVLNVCDGKIVSYKLIESGNVKDLERLQGSRPAYEIDSRAEFLIKS